MPGFFKAYLSRRERRWMADAAGLIAVTEPLADEVVRRFGVPRPTVVMNCRPRWRADEPGLPVSNRLRDALLATWAQVPADARILLYQGAFREDQGIEELLEALGSAPLRDRPLVTVFMRSRFVQTMPSEGPRRTASSKATRTRLNEWRTTARNRSRFVPKSWKR